MINMNIICKSIPKDCFGKTLTPGKIYKIKNTSNSHDNKHKVYAIFSDDNFPYLILVSKFNENFEWLRDKNLELLLN
jgi:hypothetical protein